jgi:hypothetical protein
MPLYVPPFRAVAGVGAVATPATTLAEEHGDEFYHVTKLTCAAFSLGNGGDAQDLAIGAKLYTVPAGTVLYDTASLVGYFNSAASVKTIADGQPGVGTVAGSGAVDTLAAAARNIVRGTALTTYLADGTSLVEMGSWSNIDAAEPLMMTAAGSHDIYLNFAATWPNSAAAAGFTFTGVVVFRWVRVGL